MKDEQGTKVGQSMKFEEWINVEHWINPEVLMKVEQWI